MQLSRYIDHTLLKPDATPKQIETLCQEARQYEFFSVCVNPSQVAKCAALLKGSEVKVCTVVGFPLGANTSEVKAFETADAIAKGADEVDMVLNIGALKAGLHDVVLRDMQAVVQAAKGHLVKVIIETSLLDESQKIKACELAVQAGANFVKTSTGFSGGGATVEDVLLMKKTVGDQAQVKASGGIKNAQQALDLIKAGATRLGTSSGVSLAQGLSSQGGY